MIIFIMGYEVILNNFKKYPFSIQVFGFIINYNKSNYLVTCNLGLPVEEVEFDNNKYSKFIYGHWSGLIIVKLKLKKNHNYNIYKKIVKKHIDPSNKMFIDGEIARYIRQEYFPINMMPNNPSNLYYKVKCSKSENGLPLYNNEKIFGIVSLSSTNYAYIIPSIYIIKTIEKECNEIMISHNKIKKIDRYKVYDDIIYSPEFRYQIKLETYLTLISDTNIRIKYNDNDKNILFEKLNENKNNNYILHYCKYFNREILKNIFTEQCGDKIDIEVNGNKYVYLF